MRCYGADVPLICIQSLFRSSLWVRLYFRFFATTIWLYDLFSGVELLCFISASIDCCLIQH